MIDDAARWFVMRDLTRYNSKLPAYRMLDDRKIENFTPMVKKIVTMGGKRECRDVPFIHDLLFVHDSRRCLDPIVESVSTFQYRYLKGRVPMTVRDEDMERFRKALAATEAPQFYRLEDVTPAMRQRRIRIIGGLLDGYEGTLVTVRGSKSKRLLVELPALLAVAVEVKPEYIQLLCD